MALVVGKVVVHIVIGGLVGKLIHMELDLVLVGIQVGFMVVSHRYYSMGIGYHIHGCPSSFYID